MASGGIGKGLEARRNRLTLFCLPFCAVGIGMLGAAVYKAAGANLADDSPPRADLLPVRLRPVRTAARVDRARHVVRCNAHHHQPRRAAQTEWVAAQMASTLGIQDGAPGLRNPAM
jgi:hypothetical protein